MTRAKEMMAQPFTTVLLAVTTAFQVSAAVADEHGHAHPHFAPDIDAFHSLFGPIWQAFAAAGRAEYEKTRPGAVDA